MRFVFCSILKLGNFKWCLLQIQKHFTEKSLSITEKAKNKKVSKYLGNEKFNHCHTEKSFSSVLSNKNDTILSSKRFGISLYYAANFSEKLRNFFSAKMGTVVQCEIHYWRKRKMEIK